MSNEAGHKYLLDTSAILTLMEDEEGADRVEEILRLEEVFLPFIVFLETYYISMQEQSEAIADQRYVMLHQLQTAELWCVDEVTLLTAARFKACHKLSLADALIAAFAVHQQATLVHKDPEFETLGDQVHQEVLPYKSISVA